MTPYEFGKEAKEAGVLEPETSYEPGTPEYSEYSEYVEGFLNAEAPDKYQYREGLYNG